MPGCLSVTTDCHRSVRFCRLRSTAAPEAQAAALAAFGEKRDALLGCLRRCPRRERWPVGRSFSRTPASSPPSRRTVEAYAPTDRATDWARWASQSAGQAALGAAARATGGGVEPQAVRGGVESQARCRLRGRPGGGVGSKVRSSSLSLRSPYGAAKAHILPPRTLLSALPRERPFQDCTPGTVERRKAAEQALGAVLSPAASSRAPGNQSYRSRRR